MPPALNRLLSPPIFDDINGDCNKNKSDRSAKNRKRHNEYGWYHKFASL